MVRELGEIKRGDPVVSSCELARPTWPALVPLPAGALTSKSESYDTILMQHSMSVSAWLASMRQSKLLTYPSPRAATL